MSMLLIRGSFKMTDRARPDGDTLPFVADDVADWKLVPGCAPIVPKADGRVSIRLEAIDALETHYGQKPHEEHQPRDLAHQAADRLLTLVGFESVIRDEDDETVVTVPQSVPGWILTRGSDVHGRCVAFVGKTTPPVYSGYGTALDDDLLRKTANYQLLRLGLVYPTYYAGLPGYLRELLTDASEQARAVGAGLWAAGVDKTTDGATVTGMPSITNDHTGQVILPKLFRRLKDYLDFTPDDPSLDRFRAYLAGAADEYRLLPDTDTLFSGLHHIVEVTADNTVKMTRPVRDIIFTEK